MDKLVSGYYRKPLLKGKPFRVEIKPWRNVHESDIVTGIEAVALDHCLVLALLMSSDS